MKNLFLLPTEKPSRFYSTARTLNKKRGYAFGEHYIPNTRNMFSNHNIYITSDEEIKDVRPHKGKWQLEKGQILNQFPDYLTDLSECKLVIMTTDPQLIADGVQAIDDEFLEWFVKNPSCESVEVEKFHGVNTSIAEVNAVSGDGSLNWEGKSDLRDYKIIIPKEEPKQETLEETKEELFRYSEREVLEILENYDREFKLDTFAYTNTCSFTVKEWFEKSKKK